MQARGGRIFHGWVAAAAAFAVQCIGFGVAHGCAACCAWVESELQVSRGGVSLLTEPFASLQTSRNNDKN